jgi:hypothetical protein
MENDEAAALGIGADTGPWLRPVQYEQKARPEGKRPNNGIANGGEGTAFGEICVDVHAIASPIKGTNSALPANIKRVRLLLRNKRGCATYNTTSFV